MAAVGYNHNSGGYLTIIDGFWSSMSDYHWGTRSGQGQSRPTPSKVRWYEPLGKVFSAMKATKEHTVVY